MSMHSKNKSTQNLSFFRWFNHVIKFSLLEENFENLLLKSAKMNQLKYNIFLKKTLKYALYMQRRSQSIPDISPDATTVYSFLHLPVRFHIEKQWILC